MVGLDRSDRFITQVLRSVSREQGQTPMQQNSLSPKGKLAVACLSLVAAFDSYGTLSHTYIKGDGVVALIALVLPLLIIAAAIWLSCGQTGIGAALPPILVGPFIQYGFLTSTDPSRVMVLTVSFLVYWCCAIAAVLSASRKRSASK